MSIDFDPLQNAPSLLCSAALVEDSAAKTALNIRELKLGGRPELYSSSRDIFVKSLQGQGYDWALRQAETIPHRGRRQAAETTLPLLKPFITNTNCRWLRSLEVEFFQIDSDLQIPIKIDVLARVEAETRLIVLHPWLRPLSSRQLRAAMTILRYRIAGRIDLQEAKLNLLDLSKPLGTKSRTCRQIGWENYPLMSAEELDEFTGIFREAWRQYKCDPVEPRKPKPRSDGQQSLFPET